MGSTGGADDLTAVDKMMIVFCCCLHCGSQGTASNTSVYSAQRKINIDSHGRSKYITGGRLKNQKPVVLLTRRWPEAVEAALAEKYTLIRNDADVPYSAAELAAALTQADAVCPTVTDALTADVFAAASKLGIRAKLLANFGVGYNHIDIASARANGLEITNTPGVLTAATAEIAMTLLLMCARRAGEGERLVRNGDWQGWHPTHMLSTQVTGKTLGIVGMGGT